jgi:membrane protease YdiL (CAAX protease family)
MPNKEVIGNTVIFALLLYIGWTLAWLLNLYIDAHSTILAAPYADILYWTVIRALLWVMLPMMLLKRTGLNIREIFSLRRLRTTALWGGGMGLLLGLITIFTRIISGQQLFSIEWGWPLLTMTVIAPVVEEFFFRGAVLKALETRLTFAAANLITGVLFLLAHLPGWYFQGRLANMLLSPKGGAMGVLFLGWIFGYIAHKSRSVPAAILAHALNNFFNA